MARGASRPEARRLAYKLAQRIAAKGPVGTTVTRETPAGAWCPSYLVASPFDSYRKRVRVIRASNGETAAITEDI